MLVQLDRVVDRGVLTVAPTAAGRGWNADGSAAGSATAARPPARASWTLVPDFDEALEKVQAGPGRCWSPARSTRSAT